MRVWPTYTVGKSAVSQEASGVDGSGSSDGCTLPGPEAHGLRLSPASPPLCLLGVPAKSAGQQQTKERPGSPSNSLAKFSGHSF